MQAVGRIVAGDIHPGQEAPVLAEKDGSLCCGWQRWGFPGYEGKKLILSFVQDVCCLRIMKYPFCNLLPLQNQRHPVMHRLHGSVCGSRIDVNSAYLSWEAVYRLVHKGERQDLREIASAVGGDMLALMSTNASSILYCSTTSEYSRRIAIKAAEHCSYSP